MSHPPGKDPSTSYTPIVSSMSSSPTSLRNNPPGPGQAVFTQTLIPRDYLSSLSKSRTNAGAGTASSPSPPPSSLPFSSQPASQRGGQGAVRASPIQQELSPDLSDEEDTTTPRQTTVPGTGLSVGKTRDGAEGQYRTQSATALPESPVSTTSAAASNPRLHNAMPRTSSIDSAISTISNSSSNQKSSSDGREPSTSEIRNLIATAGSAENLVQHLLRDKSHAAAQNAQLWKLVDKQRALLLGLNKDLERLTKDRDKYRKKARDVQTLHQTEQVNGHKFSPESPTIGSMSRQDFRTPAAKVPASAPAVTSSPMDNAMKPSPLHPQHQPVVVVSDPDSGAVSSTLLPDVAEKSPFAQTSTRSTQPKLSTLTTSLAPPVLNLTEATPIGEASARSFGNSRKSAPRPLDLRSSKEDMELAQMAKDEPVVEDSDMDIPESTDRGRRKTREDDDRDRERAVTQDEEQRSRSKKDKHAKPDTPFVNGDASLLPQHSVTQRPQDEPVLLSAPGTASQQPIRANDLSHLSPPPRSPGLPVSPRPNDRPLASPLPAHMTERGVTNSLPMSPRNGGFQLSPRAPKQPLPMPTNLHPGSALNAEQPSISQTLSNNSSDRPPMAEHSMSSTDIPTVYRGLVSPTLPDLLLPPNALPSIQVRVASSRLRPSRFSVLGFKPQEDLSVFTLSIFSRANSAELWRLEKIPASLPHLEQQLKQRCASLPRMPDRKLFSGHSPATIDARRTALEAYFDELLDTEIDEQSAVIICRYLSTDVLDPHGDAAQRAAQHQDTTTQQNISNGKPRKSGYLTKKGKNFGGWKSRYFVLDSQDFRYFEAPGGAHLGTIKLQSARIGRQTAHDGSHEDGDETGQFRHAFLILEPKRKDSSTFVRHVLCAENDQERDQWVQVLLHYVEDIGQSQRPTTSSGTVSETASTMSNPRMHLRGTDHGDAMADHAAKSSSPTLGHSNSGSNSPTSATSQYAEAGAYDAAYARAQQAHAGATRGAPRQSAVPMTAHNPQKIRNLFQFKKPSHEQLNAATANDDQSAYGQYAQREHSYVRPVFGLPLAEAVELCPPEGVDVLLPAVVYRCIQYLKGKRAANEEGLFRLSGSNTVIRALKDRFNTEGDIDLLAGEYYDVHAIASLFKTYLRELPSTILTRELHSEFAGVLELNDKLQKVAAFNTLVHRLPAVNYALLYALSEFLLEVVQNCEKNKMTVKNVGIVFSPTLNIPAPAVSLFLTEFDSIFSRRYEDDLPTDHPAPVHQQYPESYDVRSPRHQMYPEVPSPTHNQQSFARNAQIQDDQRVTREGSDTHQTSADLGMAPTQSSYEARNYVSIPAEPVPPPQPLYPPPEPNSQTQKPQQAQPRGNYRMMQPENTTNLKAKRRESSMLFY